MTRSTHIHQGPPPTRLIVGIDGTLGSALAQRLASLHIPSLGTSRRPHSNALPLDLANPDAIAHFNPPDTIHTSYLFAAITSLQHCRRFPDEAHRINVQHTALLAQRLAQRGIKTVILSTNQVFDGSTPHRTPRDHTYPQSVYGQTKAKLEHIVLSLNGSVVRPTKVLGLMPTLWAQWKSHWQRGEHTTAFDDLVIAPIQQRTLIEHLIDPPPGITHLSGNRDVSYTQVAQHLASKWGTDPGLIRPVSAATADIPPAERPPHTTLAGGVVEDVWDVIDASAAQCD